MNPPSNHCEGERAIMGAETTIGLADLREALGPGVVLGFVDLRHAAIVAACRSGSSSPDTDFPDQNPRQSQVVFGVACGRLEQFTLCAVVYRKRDDLDRFWRENPNTRSGLVTRWPGVRVLWLRVAGVVPRNISFGTFSWCSEGVVPVGKPEASINDFIVQGGTAPVVDFGDLHWLEVEREVFDIELIEQEMGPKFCKTSKRTILNLPFWSRLFAKRFNLSFDPSVRKFQLWMGPADGAVCLSESGLVNTVLGCLQKLSRELHGFPQRELCLKRVKEIVGLLKIEVARSELSEDESIDRYLQECIENRRGSLITSKQLWHTFLAFCRTSNLPVCPERIFGGLVRTKIRQRFAVGQSHDKVLGNDHTPRIYRNLGFKAHVPVVVELSDTAVTRIHVWGSYGANN